MRRSGKLCAPRSSRPTSNSRTVRFFEQQDEASARTRQLLLTINAALPLTWRRVTPGLSKYSAYFFAVNTVMTWAHCAGRLMAGDIQPARRWCKAGTVHGRTVGLADLEAKARWFDSHPPLAERIGRI